MIGPWQFALVALAAWRTWHLLAWDTILEPIRSRIVPADSTEFAPALGYRVVRSNLADFVECPFCLGFWVALAWVAAFWIEPHWTVIVAVPFAVSAAVALVQHIADALTEGG